MQSIMLHSPREIDVVDVPAPIPAAGEALLRMRFGGVCGSDLAAFLGTSAYISYPRTIGHEISAEVISIPENVDGIVAGDLVTVNPYFNCGECYPCRRDVLNACVNNQTMGVQREGAFGELFTIPAERVFAGSGIDARSLALIEPFSISFHGVSRADLTPGDRVLVFGAGAIGIFAALSAKSRGAKVWITDISQEKVDAAVANFGLDGGFVNNSQAAADAQIASITGGDGFDLTVEATGIAPVFVSAVNAAASRGTVLVIGVSKLGVDFNPTEIQRKELTILGSRGATRADFMATMALVRSGDVDLAPLISREVSAADAKLAFAEFERDYSQITKLLFRF